MASIQFWILLIGTFAVPAVIILGDNELFSSRHAPSVSKSSKDAHD